jgi:hypothetical protein
MQRSSLRGCLTSFARCWREPESCRSDAGVGEGEGASAVNAAIAADCLVWRCELCGTAAGEISQTTLAIAGRLQTEASRIGLNCKARRLQLST